MPRVKKSRKGGPIGVRKSTNTDHRKPPRDNSTSKPKRKKGKAPGSRHNVESVAPKKIETNVNSDKRIGSKKPVPLIVTKAPVTKKKLRTYATPRQELAALEADDRFNALLDKVDDGQSLTIEEQEWLDGKLERHQILCELLGIKPDEEENVDKDDPFAQLDAIRIDDFNDEK
ncbi:Der GTPase-activating protein YihI [Alteromonas flava]|uniref:Der GTPase-activating protein YihI n=1 Tax=Alteromonas flava TaxID=2048003 RepID=UPI000C2927D8|nr:Der GTPase-activating protein YihI [Alteromonas flava]